MEESNPPIEKDLVPKIIPWPFNADSIRLSIHIQIRELDDELAFVTERRRVLSRRHAATKKLRDALLEYMAVRSDENADQPPWEAVS